MRLLAVLAAICAVTACSHAPGNPGANQISVQEHRIVAEDGARLFVTDRGAGSTIVVLHGGLGHQGWMNNLIDALDDTHRVIAIDTRGMGRSERGTLPLTYGQQERDVEAVLSALGVRRYAIVGFSDGGIVGYRLAAEPNSPVTRLVTIGSRWSAENGRSQWGEWDGYSRDALLAGPFAAVVTDYERLNPSPEFPRLLRDAVTMWKDGGPDGHPEGAVRAIRAPVLATVGDKDPFPTVQNADALAAQVRAATLMIAPGAGHAAHQDRADIVVPRIIAFLGDQP
jgi:pimeloyl-ACP methyl ester carboxylesterase